MIYLIYCPIIYLLGQGGVQIATFDTVQYFIFFMPYMILQICCMSISYRDVPKIYLRRSLQESIFMLFCYARAVVTVVFGFKVRPRTDGRNSGSILASLQSAAAH